MKNNKKDNLLISVIVATALIYFVPDIGKKYYSDIFGTWYVQRPSIILLGIFIGFGLVRSIIITFDSSYYSSFGVKTFCVFIGIAFYLLIIWSFSLIKFTESYVKLRDTKDKEMEVVLTNIRNIRTKPDQKARFNSAHILYFLSGIQAIYLDETAEPVVFKPKEKQILKHQEFKASLVEKENLIKSFQSLIKDFQFCLIAFILSLFSTLSIYLGYILIKHGKMKSKLQIE